MSPDGLRALPRLLSDRRVAFDREDGDRTLCVIVSKSLIRGTALAIRPRGAVILIVVYRCGSRDKSASVESVTFDPKSLDLDRLFTDPDMFDSRRVWRRAGFDVFDPAKRTECMVAAHRSAPGYLFKKYPDDVSQKEQRNNYEARIEGATRLAELIRRKGLRHVVTPKKHLYKLPKSFGKSSSVLVVERLDVVGPRASERRYRDVADPVLRDLLRVLVALPGLDSNSKNVQFTQGGKIAFVDLENWDHPDRDEVQLKSIGNYLSKDRLKLASRILDELDDG